MGLMDVFPRPHFMFRQQDVPKEDGCKGKEWKDE